MKHQRTGHILFGLDLRRMGGYIDISPDGTEGIFTLPHLALLPNATHIAYTEGPQVHLHPVQTMHREAQKDLTSTLQFKITGPRRTFPTATDYHEWREHQVPYKG